VNKPEDAGLPDDRLNFEWSYREWRGNWLALGLCLAFGGLACVALFFRVERTDPRPAALKVHEVLILDASVPLVQPVLSRAADKSFVLMGTRGRSDAGPELTSYTPVFEPMFKTFDFQLKDLPETDRQMAAPQWLRPAALLLPERSLHYGSERPVAASAVPELRLRAVITRGLENRKLTRQVAVEGPVPDEVVRTRFRALVNSQGVVTWALPLHEEVRFGKDIERLRDALSRLRFQPEPNAPEQWAELRFVWEPWPER